jgi:hypothetical protein
MSHEKGSGPQGVVNWGVNFKLSTQRMDSTFNLGACLFTQGLQVSKL